MLSDTSASGRIATTWPPMCLKSGRSGAQNVESGREARVGGWDKGERERRGGGEGGVGGWRGSYTTVASTSVVGDIGSRD